MKRIIQRLAARFGCKISKLPQTSMQDPFAAMKKLLENRDSPVVFDVGAHHGKTAMLFRRLFPASTVYAFEPFKESFDELIQNTSSDPGITAFNYGLSDRDGIQAFNSNVNSQTNSLLSSDPSGHQTWGKGFLETNKTLSAEFKTLDSVLETISVPVIDILKIDVQGAEHLVMNGAVQACRQGRIQLVYSEIITQPTYSGQQRLDETLASFYNRGFDLYNIYNMDFTGDGRLRQMDVIFTRASA